MSKCDFDMLLLNNKFEMNNERLRKKSDILRATIHENHECFFVAPPIVVCLRCESFYFNFVPNGGFLFLPVIRIQKKKIASPVFAFVNLFFFSFTVLLL